MVLKDEEKVIPVDPRDMPPNSDDGKKKMLMRLLTVVVIPAAICFIMIQYAFPSIDKKTFDLNFTNVATDISSLQAKSADYESANTTIKTQFATMNNDFKTLNSKVDAINLSAYAKSSDVTEIRNGLNTLANSIANVANNSTITDIKSQVKSVSDSNTLQEVKIQANTDKNTSQDTRLATLEEQVKKLQATPTTTPTTTPTSTTSPEDDNRVIATSVREFITAKLLSYYSYGDYRSYYYGSIIAGNKVSKKLTAKFISTATSTTADSIAFTMTLYIDDLPANFKWTDFNIKAYRSDMTIVDGGTTGDDYCVFLYEPSQSSYSNIKVAPQETKEVSITMTYDNTLGENTVPGFTVYIEEFTLENIR
jgi:soluble cytochrome b562